MNAIKKEQRDGVSIRLVGNDLSLVKEAAEDMEKSLGTRFVMLSRPRQGTRGDALAFGVWIPGTAKTDTEE